MLTSGIASIGVAFSAGTAAERTLTAATGARSIAALEFRTDGRGGPASVDER
jgi:hypothetical protein